MKLDRKRFCLNRIICPNLNLEDFFEVVHDAGLNAVELRNDLPNGAILDDLTPDKVITLSQKFDIQILTINAVQRFNLGSAIKEVYADVQKMLETARSINCQAIVLCPNNDTQDRRSTTQFYQDTVQALTQTAPLFKASGIKGLLEPLGFEESSLRSKAIAIDAINESGSDEFQIVHDTFHHFLGTDEKIFASQTGIVHISGVATQIPQNQIRDPHRVLVDPDDATHCLCQIQDFERQSYTGYYAFEPFSPTVQQMSRDDLAKSLDESLNWIQSEVEQALRGEQKNIGH